MHLNLEFSESDGKCLRCGTETLLITPMSGWSRDDGGDDDGETVELGEEVSAHYCPSCDRMTSLALNTPAERPAASKEPTNEERG